MIGFTLLKKYFSISTLNCHRCDDDGVGRFPISMMIMRFYQLLSIILNKEQTRISGNVVVAINVFQLKSGSVTEPALLELQVKLLKNKQKRS